MALFKIEKGLAADLTTNRPNAVEGYCYFTTDDGLFYIDTVTGTLTGDNPTGQRVLLNAGEAAYASRANKDINGNVIHTTYATKEEVNTTEIVPLFYYETISGDGITTDFTINHNLNLMDVIIQVYDTSNNSTIQCDSQRLNSNNIQINFNEAPSSGSSYRVMVYGLDARLLSNTDYSEAIQSSEKGEANGVATLDANGKIPTSQLPALPIDFCGTITGDGTSTQFNLIHNLNTKDVTVQIYDLTDYESVSCGIIRDTNTSIRIRFATAPLEEKQYRVLIQALASRE